MKDRVEAQCVKCEKWTLVDVSTHEKRSDPEILCSDCRDTDN